MNEMWKKLREDNIANLSPVKNNNNGNKNKNDEYNLLRPLCSEDKKTGKKGGKTKSKKKMKRLKSILKQTSLRKESSHELGNKGHRHSITFILDKEVEENLSKKVSEKLLKKNK